MTRNSRTQGHSRLRLPGLARDAGSPRPQAHNRQRGIALLTVLLMMTTITLLGLATHELVESNIRISGAQYQTRVARGGAVAVMNVFRNLGKPRLAAMVPASRLAVENIDLTGETVLTDVQNALATARGASGGLINNPGYSYTAGERAYISVDYLGRQPVPPGNKAHQLFPKTINNSSFCADFFRLVTNISTSANARGAVDQNMYIVSPCLE